MRHFGKIALLLSVMFSFATAFDGVLAKAGKWQMLSYRDDVNLSNIGDLRVDNFSILWFWSDGEWKAFSKDSAIKDIVTKMGYYSDTIKADQAFWILPKKDLTITSYDPSYLPFPKSRGWHLTSSLPHFESTVSTATKAIYFFRDDSWKSIKFTQNAVSTNEQEKIFPFANEGFWIYNSSDITNSTFYGNDYRPKIEEPFSDKIFHFGDTALTFDQNGTVLSNNQEYNNGIWSGDWFDDWEIGFRIEKGDMRYFFSGYKDSSGEYTLYHNSTQKIKTLSNGIKEIVDENWSSEEGDTLSYEDFNKSTLSSTVKSAFDKISNLFDNGDSDAKSVLNDIESSLQNDNSTQAKVALSIVDFIKVLDADIVKNSFFTDSTSLDINSFFSNVVVPSSHDAVSVATNISDYNQNAKELLQTLSDRLKQDATMLNQAASDKNFFIHYKDIKINFVDVKTLRVSMLILSYKLQYLSAYDLGSSEWLKKRVENNIEYIKASSDPVAFLKSKTFFVNPKQSQLLNAKILLESALKAYLSLLEGENYEQNGLMISKSDIGYRNALRDTKMALYNLEGKQSSIDIVSDDIVYNNSANNSYNPTYKKERYTFDLNALFNTSTAITIDDIGSFSYFSVDNSSYDDNKSKINDSPTSSSGFKMSVDINDNYTYTNVNKINNFFKKMVDYNGTIYKNTSLLNKIFD